LDSHILVGEDPNILVQTAAVGVVCYLAQVGMPVENSLKGERDRHSFHHPLGLREFQLYNEDAHTAADWERHQVVNVWDMVPVGPVDSMDPEDQVAPHSRGLQIQLVALTVVVYIRLLVRMEMRLVEDKQMCHGSEGELGEDRDFLGPLDRGVNPGNVRGLPFAFHTALIVPGDPVS
jgi:hypothetical protein